MSITKIIFEYLQVNRRITIPALGTFLAKGSGEPILFSEFMKGDDGVLRALVASNMGLSELEAALVVDRFVFDLRHAVEGGESYPLSSLGYMSLEDGHIFHFVYDPSVEGAADGRVAVEPLKVAVASVTPEVDDDAGEPRVEDREMDGDEADEMDDETGGEVDDEADDIYIRGDRNGGGRRFARRVDWWMIFAVVAVMFAIFAVMYGFYMSWLVGDISFGSRVDSLLESILIEGDFIERLKEFIKR